MRVFVDRDGVWAHAFGKVIALKAPWCIALFSERNRCKTSVIPLGFGWRLTIRN